MSFFVSKEPTPILNTSAFEKVFGGHFHTLPFDEHCLVRALEMIAFSQTVFEILDTPSQWILQVKTTAYPSSTPLFIDLRFGTKVPHRPSEKEQKLPEKKEIIRKLRAKVGTSYIWGGNYSLGISKLLHYYPPKKGKQLSFLEKISWTFQGLDCSGLLYEATKGATMRNTQELLFIGQEIAIENCSIHEIVQLLKPLDLIVWKGHVIIVLNRKEVIESQHKRGGVCLTPIELRLEQIIKNEKKKPINCPNIALKEEGFVIRRFIL